MIRKVREGYRMLSESERNMGTYSTKEKAEKRLKQIEYLSLTPANPAAHSDLQTQKKKITVISLPDY
jgi:hypothetical protein